MSATTDTTSPAVDAVGAPDAAVDAAAGTAPADTGDQRTAEIAKARAERDASKRARRDAEAKADALAARVAVLEPLAAEVERLRGEVANNTSARRSERVRAVVDEVERAMNPLHRGTHVALMVESFAQSRGIDLDPDGAGAVVLSKLRASSPGLFAPGGKSHVPPNAFPSPI